MAEVIVEVDVAGADGAAVGSLTTTRVLMGDFVAAILRYTTQPSTCVVKLTEVETGKVLGTITGNTAFEYLPLFNGHNSTGGSLTAANRMKEYPIYGRVRIDVSAGNAGKVKVFLRWRQS